MSYFYTHTKPGNLTCRNRSRLQPTVKFTCGGAFARGKHQNLTKFSGEIARHYWAVHLTQLTAIGDYSEKLGGSVIAVERWR